MEKTMLDAIKHRRSIRRFSDRPIPKEAIENILEAGLYAPSAGGGQRVRFYVSDNREVNERLGRIKRANSHPKMATATVYVSREQPSIADDENIKNAFYDAPLVITLFGPEKFLFTKEDCALAAQCMMLEADELGIGSCYIGEGWKAFDDPYGEKILKKWDVPDGYYPVLQVLFGYPKEGDPHPKAKERKEGRIHLV